MFCDFPWLNLFEIIHMQIVFEYVNVLAFGQYLKGGHDPGGHWVGVRTCILGATTTSIQNGGVC